MEGQDLDKRPKNEDLIIEAKNFFDFYKKEIGESLRKAKNEKRKPANPDHPRPQTQLTTIRCPVPSA